MSIVGKSFGGKSQNVRQYSRRVYLEGVLGEILKKWGNIVGAYGWKDFLGKSEAI